MVDPTLSKTDAHKVFGDLYRKSRSPEHQQKIDQVVSSTSDVFVRIERIEQIDAEFNKKNKLSNEDLAGDPREQRRRGGGGSSGAGRGRQGSAPPRKGRAPVKKRAASNEESVSWFERLFGSEISRWGKKTQTLETGLFSKPHLAPAIPDMFRGISEAQIGSTIKSFRALAGTAWETLEPKRYNTMIAAYQFLMEFVQAESVFRRFESPQEWITATLKMQKYFAILEQYPDWQKTLQKDLPSMIRETDASQAVVADAMASTMGYIAKLNSRSPSFKNGILAMYALARERVLSWDDVVRELRVKKPALDTFRAPEQVMTRIHQRVSDLRNRHQAIQSQIKDVAQIKNQYYQMDAQGRLKTDFLNPIVQEAVRRISGDQAVVSSTVASYKREAHRLLYAILKDFDGNGLNLLTGAVNTMGEGHHSEEIILFKQGLFKKHSTLFGESLRDMEVYLKKHKDMNYSFSDFMGDLRNPPDDPVINNFIQIVKNANRMFKAINFDLNTVINNHTKAIDMERMGKAPEGMKNTAVLPIEDFDPTPRFMPYNQRVIISGGRYNDMTVQDALADIVKNFYNYLYIFRDGELTKEMTGVPEKEKELEEIKTKLAHFGVDP